eukprot:2913872-Prymnesium_polylepis.1
MDHYLQQTRAHMSGRGLGGQSMIVAGLSLHAVHSLARGARDTLMRAASPRGAAREVAGARAAGAWRVRRVAGAWWRRAAPAAAARGAALRGGVSRVLNRVKVKPE